MTKKTDNRSRLDSFNKRLESLRSDRADYINLWGELSIYHMGQRGRWLGQNGGQRNKVKRDTAQINNKSKMALRTLSSGMMTGITSPARPWFKLGSGDPDLDDFRTVKDWLFQVERRMYKVFNSSNFYNMMHLLYTHLGCFGTSSMGVFADYDNVIRCKTYPIGNYMLGLGGNDLVDTQYCEYMRSVGQLVKQFGYDNCSKAVQGMWDRGSTEEMIPIVHVIEPNDDRDDVSPFNFNMPTRSVYYERGSDGPFLMESGFKSFPIMAPRWEIDGEEVYGSDCPGITALGDTKALQLGEKRSYQALDKLGNPPLQGSANVAGKTGTNAPPPGSVTILGTNDKGLSSIYGNYGPDMKSIEYKIERTEERISRAFYEDLFLMMVNTDRRQITATEVAERHEEKLLALGPVLERLHAELLDPVVDRVFDIMTSSGLIPPPPRELQGRELAVEYISVLAQAQRMVAISGIERTMGFAASLATVWPAARHKVNASQAIDDFAHAMGVSPNMIRGDDEADELAGAEAQMAAQQQQVEQAATVASAGAQAANMQATLRDAGLQ